MGLVKNRCKNGDHYWVSAYVTPIAKNGSIVEYQSVRTKPEPEQVLGVLGIFRPKTTKCSGGPAVCGLQRGITFFEIPIWALFE